MKEERYLIQIGRDQTIYARIIGEAKGGGYRVKQITCVHTGGTFSVKTDYTKNWYPQPIPIESSDLPVKVLANLNR